jgi:hypothetical protein
MTLTQKQVREALRLAEGIPQTAVLGTVLKLYGDALRDLEEAMQDLQWRHGNHCLLCAMKHPEKCETRGRLRAYFEE